MSTTSRISILALGLVVAGVALAQPGRQSGRPSGPTQYNWWDSNFAKNRLSLSDAQTKQLNEIRQAYVGTLRDLNEAVNRAETNLNDIYNQDKIDELKADVAVDQYVNARDNLTRVLTQMSLKMRGVLTAEQWQQLVDLNAGRPGRGRGRGRGGAPGGGGSPQGGGPSRVGPAISQK